MSLDYKPGDTFWVQFVTQRADTGAATNGDSTPTGTVTKNGTDDDAVSVTVTNIDTGRYKATFAIPATYVPGDIVELSIAATVNGIAGKGIVATFRLGYGVIRSSTAAAGAAGSITLDASASATDNIYKGEWIVIVAGTGAGQVRLCTGYTGSTQVATVAPNWVTNPTSSSVFAILPAGGIDVEMFGNSTGTFSSGVPSVNASQFAGSATAATNAGSFYNAAFILATVNDGSPAAGAFNG